MDLTMRSLVATKNFVDQHGTRRIAALVSPKSKSSHVRLASAPANPSSPFSGERKRYPLEEAKTWFRDAKFGLFIHYGIYSLLGKGEWVMEKEKIPIKDYEVLASKFNPLQFDASQWVAIAKKAGQKYMTFTTKHHDGFCMWHTKQNKYNIVDATPFKRDMLLELSNECKKQGIKLFGYYSHLDWHHTDYYPLGTTGALAGRPLQGSWDRYLEYVNAQLTELCSAPYYLSGIWFDGMWDKPNEDWKLDTCYQLIHTLCPEMLVGNNHHMTPFPGEDFQIVEQDLPGQNTKGYNTAPIDRRLPLECCRTMNNSWGFCAQDVDYRSLAEQTRHLVSTVGMGSNLLLNVGPTSDGNFPGPAVDILEGVGKWLEQNGDSIYGTRPGPFYTSWFGCGFAVAKGNKAFLHIVEVPGSFRLVIPFIPGVKKVSVNTGEEVKVSVSNHYRAIVEDASGLKYMHIEIPDGAVDAIDTLIIIESDRNIEGLDITIYSSVQKVNHPIPIEKDGVIFLPVRISSYTHGIRYMKDLSALGYWQSEKGMVSWECVVTHGGRYQADIEYACLDSSSGTQYQVEFRPGQKFSGIVQGTGGWDKFRTLSLGHAGLNKGLLTVLITVSNKPKSSDGVMNIRSVTLKKYVE